MSGVVVYVLCFVDGLSLGESLRRDGVSLPTSHFMRRRIIEIVTKFNVIFTVGKGGGCELDETYFRESFQGNHTKEKFRMLRTSRQRGGALGIRGLSKEQICIMSGTNDADGVFLNLSGRGSLSAQRAITALRDKVQEGFLVATDRSSAYPTALRELRVAVHTASGSKEMR